MDTKVNSLDSKQFAFDDTTTGNQIWFCNHVFHRENGPAVIKPNGTKYWYINGQLHREDGPAMIVCDHRGVIVYELYFLRGILLPRVAVTIYRWIKRLAFDKSKTNLLFKLLK